MLYLSNNDPTGAFLIFITKNKSPAGSPPQETLGSAPRPPQQRDWWGAGRGTPAAHAAAANGGLELENSGRGGGSSSSGGGGGGGVRSEEQAPLRGDSDARGGRLRHPPNGLLPVGGGRLHPTGPPGSAPRGAAAVAMAVAAAADSDLDVLPWPM
jgi:hypothetical protein